MLINKTVEIAIQKRIIKSNAIIVDATGMQLQGAMAIFVNLTAGIKTDQVRNHSYSPT